jgi:hypothetical protein
MRAGPSVSLAADRPADGRDFITQLRRRQPWCGPEVAPATSSPWLVSAMPAAIVSIAIVWDSGASCLVGGSLSFSRLKTIRFVFAPAHHPSVYVCGGGGSLYGRKREPSGPKKESAGRHRMIVSLRLCFGKEIKRHQLIHQHKIMSERTILLVQFRIRSGSAEIT